jgi:hypothetical protein
LRHEGDEVAVRGSGLERADGEASPPYARDRLALSPRDDALKCILADRSEAGVDQHFAVGCDDEHLGAAPFRREPERVRLIGTTKSDQARSNDVDD